MDGPTVGPPLVGRQPVPQAFVDAGDRPWPQLEPVIRRALASLVSGDVLELVSGDPSTIMVVADWCTVEGYVLLNCVPGDESVTYWIEKT